MDKLTGLSIDLLTPKIFLQEFNRGTWTVSLFGPPFHRSLTMSRQARTSP